MTRDKFNDKYQEFMERGLKRKAKWAKIRELFIRLRKAHDWALTVNKKTNQKEFDRGMTQVEKLYDQLEEVGVEKTFSAMLFINGPDLLKHPEIVTQYT